MSVTVKADVVVHDFNAREMGRGPIHAIRELVRRQIKAITAPAAPATIARRERAAKAAAKGHVAEARRYAGATPDRTGQLFRDSSKLADELDIREGKDGAWELSSDRVDPRQFTAAALDRFWRRLASLVPALHGKVLEDKGVQAAIADAHKHAIYVVRDGRRVR